MFLGIFEKGRRSLIGYDQRCRVAAPAHHLVKTCPPHLIGQLRAHDHQRDVGKRIEQLPLRFENVVEFELFELGDQLAVEK